MICCDMILSQSVSMKILHDVLSYRVLIELSTVEIALAIVYSSDAKQNESHASRRIKHIQTDLFGQALTMVQKANATRRRS